MNCVTSPGPVVVDTPAVGMINFSGSNSGGS